MNSVTYEFRTLCHSKENNYIFQFVKNRKLTAIYHSHNFYELIYFVRGSGTQIINDKETVSQEKDVLLLRPGDSHCFVEQSKDIEIISLSISVEEFEKLSFVFEPSLKTRLYDSAFPISFQFFGISWLYDICKETYTVSENDCRLLLSTFFHAYIDFADNFSRQTELPICLLDAINEMKKSDNLKNGIPAFISLSNYSHSHLSRLIKKHFGVGLKQYINDLRLQQAYDELVLTDESSEEISENLGFSSYSHFQKIFKKRFLVSPSNLRKGNKKTTV